MNWTCRVLPPIGASLLLASPAPGGDYGFSHLEMIITPQEISDYGPALVVRLYAAFDNPGDHLTCLYGTFDCPMLVETATGEFYQHPLAGNTASGQLPALIELFPEVVFDTYFDIGRTLSTDSGRLGGENIPEWGRTSLSLINASWCRAPIDPVTEAGEDGRVFFMQLTIPAGDPALTGTIGVKGVDALANDDNNCPVEFALCAGDADGDRVVGVDDLVQVITEWGPCATVPVHCGADLTVDGAIDVNDLVEVIVHWGGGC